MRKLIKPLVFAACLLPFCLLLTKIFQNNLGPDPAQALAIETGEWTLRFLLITLTLTPLRDLTRQVEFVRQRRMLGLFTLFYASCHFMVWISFLLGFRWNAVLQEIVERPYITVGFSAYLILLALGITSPKAMVRKLGKNWKRLHRLIYVASVLGVIHLLWIQRTDISEPVLYGTLVFLLLGYRFAYYLTGKKRAVSQA
jgi:sulfoxide reductase heme-binding subunit YedZ